MRGPAAPALPALPEREKGVRRAKCEVWGAVGVGEAGLKREALFVSGFFALF